MENTIIEDTNPATHETQHIRCLSVVPVELEELLAEIDAEAAQVSEEGQ